MAVNFVVFSKSELEEQSGRIQASRVVSRFLSRRFHPKSRRLFPFYFSNITFRTDLLTFGVTGAVFKIAGEMRRLPAYFDNPELVEVLDLELQCYYRKCSLFPMETISLPVISHTLLPMMSEDDKWSLEMESVASRMLKPAHQTFVAPYSTDIYQVTVSNID